MTTGARHAVVFLFLLTVFLAAANLLFTSALIGRVNANKVTITQLCQSGNEAGCGQSGLWAFISQLSPPRHEAPPKAAQRARVLRQFALHLHQVFKPRDCTKGTP